MNNSKYFNVTIDSEGYRMLELLALKKKAPKTTTLKMALKYYTEMSKDAYDPMKSLNEAREKISKIKLKPGFKKYKSSELDISNAY